MPLPTIGPRGAPQTRWTPGGLPNMRFFVKAVLLFGLLAHAAVGCSAPMTPADSPQEQPVMTNAVPNAAPDLAPESLEINLSQAADDLQTAWTMKPQDNAAIAAAARKIQTTAGSLATQYRSVLLKSDNRNLRDWLEHREPPPIRRTADLARLIYAGATAAAVEQNWRDQADRLSAALTGLIQRDKTTEGLWIYWQDGQEGRAAGAPFFRAEAIRNTATDLVKLLELLAEPPPAVAIDKGELLFEDRFAALAPNWKPYGSPTLRVMNGQLTIEGKGCAVWLEREFENVIVSFDYTPVKLAPRAGALFALPGLPMAGHDWADAAGPMERYNRMILTYHASLCRGGSGMTNLRRTGTGLRMLSTVQPDPCAELNRTYRVEMISTKGSLYVLVDGKLQHAYADAGVHGPILSRGRFGIRLFAGGVMAMRVGQFQVYRVRE